VDDGKEDAKDVIRTGGEKRYRWLQRATTWKGGPYFLSDCIYDQIKRDLLVGAGDIHWVQWSVTCWLVQVTFTGYNEVWLLVSAGDIHWVQWSVTCWLVQVTLTGYNEAWLVGWCRWHWLGTMKRDLLFGAGDIHWVQWSVTCWLVQVTFTG
jgi:hypothetical protein